METFPNSLKKTLQSFDGAGRNEAWLTKCRHCISGDLLEARRWSTDLELETALDHVQAQVVATSQWNEWRDFIRRHENAEYVADHPAELEYWNELSSRTEWRRTEGDMCTAHYLRVPEIILDELSRIEESLSDGTVKHAVASMRDRARTVSGSGLQPTENNAPGVLSVLRSLPSMLFRHIGTWTFRR